jgi:hypothetical protein
MTRTEHVGIGSGWVLRLIVRDGKPLLYAHGPEGGWERVDRADATDRAWLRSSRWTPPLPPDTKWP